MFQTVLLSCSASLQCFSVMYCVYLQHICLLMVTSTCKIYFIISLRDYMTNTKKKKHCGEPQHNNKKTCGSAKKENPLKSYLLLCMKSFVLTVKPLSPHLLANYGDVLVRRWENIIDRLSMMKVDQQREYSNKSLQNKTVLQNQWQIKLIWG